MAKIITTPYQIISKYLLSICFILLTGHVYANANTDFQQVANEQNVPVELLQAISFINTNMVNRQGISHHHTEDEASQLRAQKEIEGSADYFGIMGLTETQIEQASALISANEQQIKTNNRYNIEAAAVLINALVDQQFGPKQTNLSLGDYYFVIAAYADYGNRTLELQFANEVFNILRRGVQPWHAGDEQGIADTYLLKPVARSRFKPNYWKAIPAHYKTPITLGHEQTLDSRIDSPVADTYLQSKHYSSRGGTSIKRIVLHTCEGSGPGCANYLTDNSKSVSAHYVVMESGSVTQLVKEKDKAHHVSCCNSESIGIEHGGYAHKNTWTAAQLQASYDLICDIVKRNNLPITDTSIISHAKLDPSRRTDPGPYYPWDTMFAKVRACANGQPAVKPDLKIERLWWSPTNPKVDEIVTFRAYVINADAATGANVGVAFFVNNQQVGWDAIEPMSADSTYQFTMRDTWTANSSGQYAIKALVDDTGIVSESNENNNVANQTLTVISSDGGGNDDGGGNGDGDGGNNGGGSCAFAVMSHKLDNSQRIQQKLRVYRDENLKSSTIGQQIIDIYYKHSEELKTLMAQDKQLKKDGFVLFLRVLKSIKSDQTDNLVPLNPFYTKKAQRFIQRAQLLGSDELKQDYDQLTELLSHIEGYNTQEIRYWLQQ